MTFVKFTCMIAGINLVNDMTTKLNKIDLNLFVIFDAIYTERNLTRVAERLSITQPAVSNALTRLRKTLNDPLFVKTSTGMQPTALAESISDRISAALHQLQAASAQGERFDPFTSKRLFRVSLVDLHSLIILPGLLSGFQRTAPQVELSLVRIPRRDTRKALQQGTIDIASDIPMPDSSDLISRTIMKDRYVCAMRPDHPLGSGPLTLERYLQLTHLHVSSRPQGASPVDIVLRKLGARRKLGLQMQSYLNIRDILHKTDMVATLTECSAREMGLRMLRLPVEVPPIELRLYRHIRSDGDEAVQWMFDQIAGRTVRANETEQHHRVDQN